MKTKMIILGLLFLFFVINFAGDCDGMDEDKYAKKSEVSYNEETENFDVEVECSDGRVFKDSSENEQQAQYLAKKHSYECQK